MGRHTVESTAKGKLLAAMFIFGTIGIFVRWIPLPSSVIALTRGCVGTLFLLLTMLVRGARVSFTDVRRNLLTLCLSGAFIGAGWILIFESYRYTTVATATLSYYLAPVFVILASPILLKERLTLTKALCALAALMGMVLISGVLQTGLGGGTRLKGVLLGLGSAVLYAAVILMSKGLQSISAYDTAIMELGISAVVLLLYTLITQRGAEIEVSIQTLLLLAVVGVIHTGVAYALYFAAIKGIQAQTAAIFSYIDPIVAILLSALLLREPMGLSGVLGAVLVLGAALVSELAGASQKGSAPQ